MKNINIDNFNGFDVQIEYKSIIDKYSKGCCEIIKDNSPKKRGKYAKGWVAKADTDYLGNYSVVVENETDWQLTHLLENGHIIANKKGGVGWASPKPHIKKGFNAVRNRFSNDIKKVNLIIISK